MEANQITVRLDDEGYVRSVWDFGYVGIYGYGGTAKYLNFALIGKEVMGANEAQMWELAAEYTRERLEQVRQRREEIALIERVRGYMATDSSAQPIIAFRIKARLESELATMTRGMKPEALEGATR